MKALTAFHPTTARFLLAVVVVIALLLALTPHAKGHGGSSGGGHCGGGHFSGACHGGNGHGFYGGYYGGWWGGGLWDPYPYSTVSFDYGAPDYPGEPMYYPQYNPALATHSLAREVQQGLAQAGYYRGDVDGKIGPVTRSAIGRYQAAHHLPVTDRIDEALLQSLHLI